MFCQRPHQSSILALKIVYVRGRFQDVVAVVSSDDTIRPAAHHVNNVGRSDNFELELIRMTPRILQSIEADALALYFVAKSRIVANVIAGALDIISRWLADCVCNGIEVRPAEFGDFDIVGGIRHLVRTVAVDGNYAVARLRGVGRAVGNVPGVS